MKGVLKLGIGIEYINSIEIGIGMGMKSYNLELLGMAVEM